MIARAIVAAALSVLCMESVASAHAMLERANPMVGGIVRTLPGAIGLRFSEPIEPALSTISLSRSDGVLVALAPARASEHNLVLNAALGGALAPGTYRVHWRVVSLDTHITQGDFSFRFAP